MCTNDFWLMYFKLLFIFRCVVVLCNLCRVLFILCIIFPVAA